jgi:tRNA nucleotidyltransferase (CCA-adding enzyme)
MLRGIILATMPVIEFRAALEAALPTGRVERLRQIQRAAAESGAPTYLVGGVARDLLLGRQPGDLDLVVQARDEADDLAGPRLAQAMARGQGGELTVHRAFGTATWLDPEGEPIDFATARTEVYEQPAALPKVSPATSILADLSRRDFTINAMAIRVDGELFGEVLDPYQGQDDLLARQVRVLHGQSLQDDPTRIFRAVRYEQRLGFQLSRETLAQVPAGLASLPALSGERVRHELELIFDEPAGPAMLARLQALGVLAATHPALSWGEAQTRRAEAIPTLPVEAWRLAGPLDQVSILLTLLLARATPAAARAALQRLSAHRRLAEAVPSALELRLASAVPSEVVAQLDTLSLEAVVAAYVLRPEIRTLLHQYLSRWRFVSAETTGDDLLALGLKPGPDFSRWLWGLRAARLDGAVADRGGELALIRAWTKTE